MDIPPHERQGKRRTVTHPSRVASCAAKRNAQPKWSVLAQSRWAEGSEKLGKKRDGNHGAQERRRAVSQAVCLLRLLALRAVS